METTKQTNTLKTKTTKTQHKQQICKKTKKNI